MSIVTNKVCVMGSEKQVIHSGEILVNAITEANQQLNNKALLSKAMTPKKADFSEKGNWETLLILTGIATAVLLVLSII